MLILVVPQEIKQVSLFLCLILVRKASIIGRILHSPFLLHMSAVAHRWWLTAVSRLDQIRFRLTTSFAKLRTSLQFESFLRRNWGSEFTLCRHQHTVGWSCSWFCVVVRLSPLRVRWNGTRFHTHSGTLFGVPTASDRRWKLIFLWCEGMIRALEALRDTLYKSTTITTINTTTTTTTTTTTRNNKILW